MHTSLLPAASLLMRSLGWALLYTLWQGAIIYIGLSILLRLFKNISPQVKYYLSFASLAATAAWFIDTWINQWQRLQTSTVFITPEGAQNGITHTIAVPTLQEPAVQNNILHLLSPQLETYMPLIISVYMAGLLFMLFRFSINLWQVQQLRKQGLRTVDNTLSQQLLYWQNQLDISRPIRLYLSDRIDVPAMMGVMKPIILLPFASISQLSTEQLEAVLIHELAHIKRHDYLLNILQTVVETLLFFNPFIWWMSAIIRREREHCCDDIVLTHTSQALSYAKALAQLESYRSVPGTMALAVTGNKNQLFNRIKRIMEMKKNSVNYSQLSIALVVIVALVVSIAWFTPSYAQHSKMNHDKDTTTVKKSHWSVDETYTFTDDNGNTKVYHSYDEIPADKKKLLKEGSGKHGTNVKKVIVKTDKDEIDGARNITEVPWDEVGKAMAEINWDEIGADIGDAMKDFHLEAKEINKEQFQHFMDSMDVNGMVEKALIQAKEAIKNIPDDEKKAALNERIQKAEERMQKQMEKGVARANARNVKAQTYVITSDDDDNEAPVAINPGSTVKAKVISINSDDDAPVSVSSGNTNLKAKHIIIKTDDADNDVVVARAGNNSSGGSYEKMLNQMQREGLLDRSTDFKIEKHDGVLYINGNEQTREIYNKYKRYLTGKKVIIKGGASHLKITVKE